MSGIKPGILYLSYTGLLEPLGQSQVLQYVLGLARSHRMLLLTFEKPESLQDASRVLALAEECRLANVEWHYLKYHNRPNALATAYDIVMGVRKGVQLVRDANVEIVHCRSYPAGLMGLLVKRATAVRHIFDMRGFWPDERADAGIWAKQSARYKLAKRVERALFLGTDHVVSLTHAGAGEFRRFDYLIGRLPPVSVIPTCTNLQLFQPATNPRDKDANFTLGYVGSTGSWHLFDDVARVVRLLFDDYPQARFLVISQGAHDAIRSQLQAAGVDLSRVEIKAVSFEHVAHEIARMDAGIFFYKPVWSKHATCPTRMGEFLAVGKPCLANGRIGDVEKHLGETRTGIVVNDMSRDSLKLALHDLVAMSGEHGITERCRTAAQERFSLESGINSYAAIYASLTETNGRGAT